MSTIKEIDQESRYDILQNEAGEQLRFYIAPKIAP